MKRVALALLFTSSLLGTELPSLIAGYLDGIQMESQEQHDRVGQYLVLLESMSQEDLCLVMGYLCAKLQDQQEDCGCDCCCDDLIEEELAKCSENCS